MNGEYIMDKFDPYNFDTEEEYLQFHYQEDCKRLLRHYGEEHQRLKLVEECSELIRAIIRKDEENIKEEIADVLVLIDQLTNGIEEEIKGIKAQKVARQLERIKNAKNSNKPINQNFKG